MTISTELATPANLELKYFDGRGVAETARVILALAEAEYTDTRFRFTPGSIVSPEFEKAKESGDLDANLGRAPLLVVDGAQIGQSKAIERFLANKFGFMGNSDIEAAQIDCIAEHCRDIKDAQAKKGFSMFTRDKTDEEKAESKKEWYETDMPAMLEKLEKAVALTSGKAGYAVGEKITYADIAIFSLIKDPMNKSEQEVCLKAAESCALLLSIADKIASDSNVSKWIKSRPETMF